MKKFKGNKVLNCILKKGKAFNLGFRGSNSLVFLNKKIIIVYKRWENNGTKTYRVSGFCFKIKKKKFETLLLLKSKDKSAEVTMGFILESPNLVRINII